MTARVWLKRDRNATWLCMSLGGKQLRVEVPLKVLGWSKERQEWFSDRQTRLLWGEFVRRYPEIARAALKEAGAEAPTQGMNELNEV